MSGWYNPLPIGQSATNPTGEVGRYAWEVGGLWFFRLPGQCGVIALPRTAHRTLLHESPFLLLHTTSSPLFSQLAFVISRVRYFSRSLLPTHPPWQIRIAPPLPHRETSVVTISRGKGSGFHAPPPTVESDMRLARDTCVFSLGLILSWVFLGFSFRYF